jgi:hypothetical protein
VIEQNKNRPAAMVPVAQRHSLRVNHHAVGAASCASLPVRGCWQNEADWQNKAEWEDRGRGANDFFP